MTNLETTNSNMAEPAVQLTDRERLNCVFDGLAHVRASPEAVAMALDISTRKARRELASAAARLESRQEAAGEQAGCAPVLPFLVRGSNCRMRLDRLLELSEARGQPILRTFARVDSQSTSICIRD